MDEFELIRRFFSRRHDDAAVQVGIGDDGAVIAPAPGRNLVVVVDTLIAGVHFPLSLPARDTGYRAVAVNLSDIAAMGARPRWMTLALTLTEADESWLTDFASGLFDAAREFDLSLIGGDTTRGSQTVVSVQLLGDIEPDAVMTRGGAAAGDGIFLTGTLGDAAAGLALLQSGDDHASAVDASFLIGRFARPSPRVDFGVGIAAWASAAIDLSDGLGGDLVKLLQASGVAGRIDLDLLPLSEALRRAFGGDEAGRFALSGGDDYELCFTASTMHEPELEALASRLGVALTRIGTVGSGKGLVCFRDGKPVTCEDQGYSHF